MSSALPGFTLRSIDKVLLQGVAKTYLFCFYTNFALEELALQFATSVVAGQADLHSFALYARSLVGLGKEVAESWSSTQALWEAYCCWRAATLPLRSSTRLFAAVIDPLERFLVAPLVPLVTHRLYEACILDLHAQTFLDSLPTGDLAQDYWSYPPFSDISSDLFWRERTLYRLSAQIQTAWETYLAWRELTLLFR